MRDLVNLKWSTRVILALFSGALNAAAFPKAGLWFLAWAGLVPLYFALKDSRPKDALKLGFVFGLVYFIGTLYWITYVLSQYGGLPGWVGAFLMVLLCAYMALYPALFALMASLPEPGPWRMGLGLPAAFCLLEYLRGWLLTGFPWSLLGHTQHGRLKLIQVSDIFGDASISFLIVAVNGGLFWLLGGTSRGWRRAAPLALAAALVGLSLAYGLARLPEIERSIHGGKRLKVALVQGNIPQDEKWLGANKDLILEKYRKMTLETRGFGPDLIVWPETATPFFFGLDAERSRGVAEIAKGMRAELLFGSPAAAARLGKVVLFNRAYLLNRSGEYAGRYDKVHLVPFGEYVPLKKILFFAKRLVQAAGDFKPGRSLRPLPGSSARLGVLICYEVIFPELSRGQVIEGAQVLVNITNDAWFGRSSAPYQHLAFAVFRAVENRKPIIRCANTGISAIIDQRGRVSKSSPIFEDALIRGEVRVTAVGSLYTHYPNAFFWVCVIIALALVRPQSIKEILRWKKTSR